MLPMPQSTFATPRSSPTSRNSARASVISAIASPVGSGLPRSALIANWKEAL